MTPTSARSFSSMWSHRSGPGRPRSARRGAWLVDVANRALPRPPREPRIASTRWPGVAIGDDGPDRHLQHEVGAARAVAVRALPVGSTLGVVVAAIVEIEECRQ